jgi:hypothetical protein
MMITASDVPKYQIASISNRPLRLGYIVNTKIEAEILSKVFMGNSLLWGGLYNIFIPTDGDIIRADWWRILYVHDPDIVVYVGEVSNSLAEQIYTKLQPFDQFVWNENWLTEVMTERDVNGLSVWALLRKHHEDKGVIDTDHSNCRYPIISTSRYSQFLELLYGSYPEESVDGRSIKGAFQELLGAIEVKCQPQNFEEYISLLKVLNKKVTPLEFTSQYLSVRFSSVFQLFPTGLSAVISDGSIDDLFLFHVTRWTGGPGVYVLAEDAQNDETIQAIAGWIGPQIKGNVFPIGSLSVDLEILRDFRDRLRKYLPHRDPSWHIDIRWCNFGASIATLPHSERKQQAVTVQDSRVIADIPDFELRASVSAFNRWVAEVDLSPASGNRQGFQPSMFRDLNFLLSGHSDQQWFYATPAICVRRVARGNLAMLAGRDHYLADFRLPSPSQLIKTALKNSGFEFVAQDRPGKLSQGMVDLVGGITHMRFMRSDYMLRLFDEIIHERARNQKQDKFLRKTKAYSYNDLRRFAKAGKENETELERTLENLAGKRVFLRGYNLDCTHCGLTTWYQLTEAAEWVTCKGCGRLFQIPLQGVNFSYYLNELFLEGLHQGSKSVILTALLVHNFARHSVFWQTGYRIEKDGQETEVDFIAMCDGALILSECKDSFEFENLSEEKQHKFIEQIQTNIRIARELDADVFLFSTLRKTPIPDEVQQILQTADEEGSTLRIRAIHREDLLSGWFQEPGEEDKPRFMQLGYLLKDLPLHDEPCFERDTHAKGIGFEGF